MRLLIMGAGSLGSVVGGLMAKSGHEVTLVGRAPHMEAIRRNGLRITGIWGEHLVSNLTAATDTSACTSGNYDLILVTVKSYDTAVAAETIAPLMGDETLVCSYQNGLGNVECLADAVGWMRETGLLG